MDFGQAIETQRLKLLRIVAGLVVLVGFLSLGPVSRGFSVWACGFVESILSRAEVAARYLIITQTSMMAARSGMGINQSQISESLARAITADDADVSLSVCRGRLRVLRAVLLDLPRHALRLLHRIEKRMRRTGTHLPYPMTRYSTSLRDWRLAVHRIERPPDKDLSRCLLFNLPRNPAGGVGGCALS